MIISQLASFILTHEDTDISLFITNLLFFKIPNRMKDIDHTNLDPKKKKKILLFLEMGEACRKVKLMAGRGGAGGRWVA